jgi:hypothetical protein
VLGVSPRIAFSVSLPWVAYGPIVLTPTAARV